MDPLHVLHMNKGEDEASYAKNCTVQRKILSITKPYIVEAIKGYYNNVDPNSSSGLMSIAELGCSSGPNALTAVFDIIEAIDMKRHELGQRSRPELMVYLNDLPGNDFNGVFSSLSDFKTKLSKNKCVDNYGHCFIVGLPGTFYGRLLPNQTLHFVHSSSCLHWLSQVPPSLSLNGGMINKGNLYASRTSPKVAIDAYVEQFNRDMIRFLECRSKEVISGGRMILTMTGSPNNYPHPHKPYNYSLPWDLLSQALMALVSQGLIEEEKVDNFNVPFYAPCLEELREIVEEEASFSINFMEAFELEWDGGDANQDLHDMPSYNDPLTRGQKIAKMHRAVVESMFEYHFGKDNLDALFGRYATIVDHHLNNHGLKIVTLVASLIRN